MAFNRNKARALICIAVSAVVSAGVIAWMVLSFL